MAAGIPLVPTHPADPYAWAVQQANQQYPRLAQYNMRLTYNPKREGYSETFNRDDQSNPFPGNYTVEMGNSPYYRDKTSWPGLVGLEGLHVLNWADPQYRALVAPLIQSVKANAQQMATIQQRRAQRPDLYVGDKRTVDQLLAEVDVPEIIRDRMFAPLFHKMEGAPVGGWNEYHMTPEQQKLIDQIDRYVRMK